MNKKVSIEYAHIYTNQHISQEHELSISTLNEIMKSTEDTESTANLVVMVDDYSFPDPSFNYDSFINWLDAKGFKPDLLIRESQLIPTCDIVLGLIKDTPLKNQITDYIKIKKYPCSLFIATWYLLRLGKIKSPIFPTNLYSDELINILPESFKPFEDKAIEIISSTTYAEYVDSIKYKFIQGRLIA